MNDIFDIELLLFREEIRPYFEWGNVRSAETNSHGQRQFRIRCSFSILQLFASSNDQNRFTICIQIDFNCFGTNVSITL